MRQGCRFFICIFVFGILCLGYQRVNWYTWQEKYPINNQTRTSHTSIGTRELIIDRNIQNHTLGQQKYTKSNQTSTIHTLVRPSELVTDRNIQNQNLKILSINNLTTELSKQVHNFVFVGLKILCMYRFAISILVHVDFSEYFKSRKKKDS